MSVNYKPYFTLHGQIQNCEDFVKIKWQFLLRNNCHSAIIQTLSIVLEVALRYDSLRNLCGLQNHNGCKSCVFTSQKMSILLGMARQGLFGESQWYHREEAVTETAVRLQWWWSCVEMLCSCRPPKKDWGLKFSKLQN